LLFNIGYSAFVNSLLELDMNQQKRALVALALFAWATTSMYLVWYTKYELVGVGGFLVLAAIHAYFKKPSLGGVA
jgi:hypothetical protein